MAAKSIEEVSSGTPLVFIAKLSTAPASTSVTPVMSTVVFSCGSPVELVRLAATRNDGNCVATTCRLPLKSRDAASGLPSVLMTVTRSETVAPAVRSTNASGPRVRVSVLPLWVQEIEKPSMTSMTGALSPMKVTALPLSGSWLPISPGGMPKRPTCTGPMVPTSVAGLAPSA